MPQLSRQPNLLHWGKDMHVQYSYLTESYLSSSSSPLRHQGRPGPRPSRFPAMPHRHYQMETAIIKLPTSDTTATSPSVTRSGVAICFVERPLQRRPTRSCPLPPLSPASLRQCCVLPT
ncbi:hypothetical protein LZ31DRAFT_205065 [Colletotrichum somersetense]|nr:hypothetical protein LZ31DRAFT_205065 [Colletotrichum somersetense]